MRFPLPREGWGLGAAPARAVHALNGVSLDLMRGECLALVGESGSGKTTLANCIAGAVVPVEGEIWLDQTCIARDGALTGLGRIERARRIQVIFQDPTSALSPRLTIGRTLAEPLLVHRLCERRGARARVAALLERVGLPAETAGAYPHEVNASQRQRVVIARALALEPEVLIADEPIAKLDVSMQGQILNLIEELRRALGVSVLFITHDLSVVRQIASRVAVLYLGRLMELEEREAFFRAPRHPYSQALLKSSPRLRLRAEDRILYTVEGEIPSPIDLPPGCPFASRCPEVDDGCTRRRPEPHAMPGGGLVACLKREGVQLENAGP
jgi:oligopeptide/dipeptide ABC transporter ATP-binding protein